MCGIAGAVVLAASPKTLAQSLEAVVERMSGRMLHRGPDGGGVWSSPSGAVALGHRRLAIVDLSAGGHQPMSYAGGRYWITFNGEIYNFRELSARLQGLGHQFRSGSDTEVLLAAISQWGLLEGVQQLVGMFAFALWDEQERVLHMARDRLGEKPLYLSEIDGRLFFASELRAFHAVPGFQARVSAVAAAAYLRDGCVPGKLAMYDGVYKLGAGQMISIPAGCGARLTRSWLGAAAGAGGSGGELIASTYWSAAQSARQGEAALITDEHAALEEVEEVLRRSVGMQMHADVPTGAFLSGGVDSSLVVALTQAQSSGPVHTFTVAFDDPRFDESSHARAIATHLGTRHEEFVLAEKDIVARVPSLMATMDEPTANGSFFAVSLISQLARTRVKVVLSGDGGDELFAGYNRYVLARRAWAGSGWLPAGVRGALANVLVREGRGGREQGAGLLRRWTRLGSQANSAATLGRLARLLRSRTHEESYRRLTSCWDDGEAVLDGPQEPPPRHWERHMSGDLARMLLADQIDYLPDDSLSKVDRASMAASLETRLPLLDHRLVELSWRLPGRLKLAGGVTKQALRSVLYKYVPRELIERPKMGFSVPVDAWLRGPLKEWAAQMLHDRGRLRALPLRAAAVEQAWQSYQQGRGPTGYEMWALVMLTAWAGAPQA